MSAVVAILAVLFAGAGATVVALALRASGLKNEVRDADAARIAAEDKLEEKAKAFDDYKRRTETQLELLRGDISDLEDDLEKCTTPGARRVRLERLLSKAAAPEGGDGEGGVSSDGG